VTLGRDLTVSWFDLSTGTTVHRQAVVGDGTDLTDALRAVSPDGRTLAIGQWQGPLFLWDLTSGLPIPDAGGRPDNVRNVAFDPADPATLVIATATGEVASFDVASNSAIGQPVRVHGNGMRSVTFDASGQAMAAFADDRRISLWGNVSSAGLVDSPYSDDPDLDHAIFSPDGIHVLLFGTRAEIHLADDPTAPGTVISPPVGSGDTGYYHAQFDGDGSRVLLGATDIPAYVADAATGTALWSDPIEGRITRDISPDGTTVVADRDGTSVELWDVYADKQVAAVKLADLGVDGLISTTLAFSSDGKFVDAVTNAGAVRLSVPSLALVSAVESRRAQCTVTHVPGSGLLASMDGAGRVSLFDMAAGTVVRTGVSRDSTSICGVGASPDGLLVAAHQSFTQRVALFDAASMRAVGAPIPVGAGDGWLTPAFRDATRMVDVGPAGGLAVYDLDPDTWQADVCALAGRNLTAAEWSEYLGTDEPYRATCRQWPAGA
ncbi:MAG: WD40 repeat domain-containing protein, partial [Acidimicrobiales bacterium]